MIINLTLTCGVPGLHRNLDDTEAVQVLRDVANNRVAAIAILKLVIEQRIISCFVS